MAESGDDDTLKVLCIHGYRQNAQTFREKTGAFRKILKNKAELVFITAPNIVPPLKSTNDSSEQPQEDAAGWWYSRADDYFDAHDQTDYCKGYDQSLQVIFKAIKEQGPFDGILGFSQGASMVSLLCGMQEQQTEKWFNFAILVAGFKSKSTPHNELYRKKISIPTLHVFGDTDQVIEKDMSEGLLQYFDEPVVLQHPGGHFIPASGQHKQIYLQFLDKMLALKTRSA